MLPQFDRITRMDKKFQHIHFAQNYSVEAAKWLREKIEEALKKQGFAIIGLSGGSTPGPIYEELGKANLDWSKVHVFLVDDRYTPREDKDSNQNLLDRTLLKNAKIPLSNLVFPDVKLPLEKCISDYDAKIIELFKKGNPDVVTLGRH